MEACPGSTTWRGAQSLCAAGYKVCTAAQWAANFGGVHPINNYWVADNLGYGGASNACYASTTSEGNCGPTDPMRVCGAATDAEGNRCNWLNCGLNASSPNDYFGGCVGDDTAGALCCLDVPNCVPTLNAAGAPNTPQTFAPGVFGCPGEVTWDKRAELCGQGCAPCSAAQYVQYSGGAAPTYDYWTDDNLQYGGSGPNSCVADQSSYADSTSCGTTNGIPTPMRVCVPGHPIDPAGNRCNWYGCGYDDNYASSNFGGCSGDTTAGTICCCDK